MLWIYKKIVRSILFSKPWKYFVIYIAWRFRVSNYYAKTNGIHYEACRTVIQPGDHVLCADYAKLTSKAIPGPVDHYAIYRGLTAIYEMIHVGFNITTLFDIFKESDRVIVMRTEDPRWTREYVDEFLQNASNFQGKPYDASLSFGVDGLYCSELGYQADEKEVIDLDASDLAGIGQPYISPMAFLVASNNRCIYDSDNEFTGLSGRDIEILIDRKQAK